MLSQVSVEYDNNYWVNCVKSQDCRRTLAGEARTKAGNDTYLYIYLFLKSIENIKKVKFNFIIDNRRRYGRKRRETNRVHSKEYFLAETFPSLDFLKQL